MKFSVISPVYNAHKTISRCIEGLKKQSFTDFEVIFVDSSPDDFSRKIIINSGFILIHSIKKLSSQTARNLGSEKSNGDILVFLDPDCIPDPDWLLNLNLSFDYGFDIVGGSIALYPGNYIAGAAHIEKYWLWLPNSKSTELNFFPTANFSIRKNLFFEMNKFYEKYEAADFEFCYRITNQKLPMYFNSKATVRHIHDITLKELLLLRFDRGKKFAAMKIHRYKWNRINSLLYIILSLIIPFYNLIHWGFVCFNRKFFKIYIISLPVLFISENFWYQGQNINYFRHLFRRDYHENSI